ncbi:uncharacterized protein ISCGN_002942 [Ixodes scapularis]
MEVVKSLAALLKDSPASLIEKEEDHVQPAFPVMQVRGGASSSPLTVVLEDCSFEVTDIVAGRGRGGEQCSVIDLVSMAVKVQLHWAPDSVPNRQVKKELERKVSEITRDLFQERVLEAVEPNTHSVRLTLRKGYTAGSLPHELRLEGSKMLVVVPERALLCLRCRRTGHIRRNCRVPRCADCHCYGHEAAVCIKTYATVAPDRKAEDQTDYMGKLDFPLPLGRIFY